jgi:cobalt-zinc-cadmium efflux system membrane fusion protein
MAMKRMPWIFLAVLAAGCQRPAPEPVDAADGLEASSVTQWTGKTELFAEYPPLVVGQTSRFAIHLTRLDTFKALTEGRVEVRLAGGGGPVESFPVDGPSRPGIFGVDVKPAQAGNRELTIVLRHPGLDDQHVVGDVVVHKDEASARAAPAGGDDGGADAISFLKEQQWVLDFGTAVVTTAPVREGLRVAAVIEARPGGAADVTAPSDGRLSRVADLSSGAVVTQGQELARIQPPPGVPGELPQLQQAQAEAASAVQVATRDRERAERLVAAGAAPQKRLDDALGVEEQARARATGAEARLALYGAARAAGTAPTEDGQFIVRSPVSGVVAERTATTGAGVSAGGVLFRIVDARHVHVAGQVPEAQLATARQFRSAEIEAPGTSSRTPVGRLVGFGRVLDPRTRTVPIAFVLDNSALGLALGQSVFLHLLGQDTKSGPVVPASAVVDDAGRPIVFVQMEGESFERRPVTLGARSGDVIQVLNGVNAGERVVTTGAYLVRLASLSTQVPAHGHVH